MFNKATFLNRFLLTLFVVASITFFFSFTFVSGEGQDCDPSDSTAECNQVGVPPTGHAYDIDFYVDYDSSMVEKAESFDLSWRWYGESSTPQTGLTNKVTLYKDGGVLRTWTATNERLSNATYTVSGGITGFSRYIFVAETISGGVVLARAQKIVDISCYNCTVYGNDSWVDVSINSESSVPPNQPFNVSWSADWNTAEWVDGRILYTVTLFEDGREVRSWSADTERGDQVPSSGSYTVSGGISSDTEYRVVAEVAGVATGRTDTDIDQFVVEAEPDTACSINSFTVDRSPVSRGESTNLRFSLSDRYPWNIRVLGGSQIHSGTDTGKTVTTGEMSSTKTFRLTCDGDVVRDVTLPVTIPPEESTCTDQNAENYGGALPCTYPANTCQDRNAENFGGTLPCTYPPINQTCTDPNATNYGRELPCVFSQTCQDRNAENFGGALPCTYPSNICQDVNAENYGGVGSCQYFTPPPGSAVCTATSACISATSYTLNGNTTIRANWQISSACSSGLPIIQNVIRYRPSDEGWNMNNYFARPYGVNSYTFAKNFTPGAYTFSIKLHNASSKEVELEFACETRQLNINKIGNGDGVVTGAGSYGLGTTATPTAVPNQTSTFAGWGGHCSGDGTGNNNQTEILMDGNKTCSARFTAISAGVPFPPNISGPINGAPNRNHTFTITGNDPDGEQVRYGIDWKLADGTVYEAEHVMDGIADTWLPEGSGYVDSGTPSTINFSWASLGPKKFQALTQNASGANSTWTAHGIVISNISGLPDLTVSPVVPNSAFVGVPVMFSTIIRNIGF